MNYNDFIKSFYPLGEYYGVEISESLADLYFSVLRKYSIDEFKKALNIILATHKYAKLPKIADFIEAIEGSADEKAIIAWEVAVNASLQASIYDSYRFSDEVINRAINSLDGGFEALIHARADNLPFLRVQFIKAYSAFAGKNLDPSYIVGRSEKIGQDPKIEIKLLHGDLESGKILRVGQTTPEAFKANSAQANALEIRIQKLIKG